MEQQSEAELKLTVDLLKTRQQLVEAHGQLMAYQHRELDAQVAVAQKRLDDLVEERDRNRPVPMDIPV